MMLHDWKVFDFPWGKPKSLPVPGRYRDRATIEVPGWQMAEMARTETAQKQPTPSDSNVNETGADAG